MLFPGCYCKNCGQTFAMYSFGIQPGGNDENGKACFSVCRIGDCRLKKQSNE